MSGPKALSTVHSLRRPDVFGYHDFRAFLRDWFAYLKSRDSRFSVRSLSEEIEVAHGYLPMVLSGSRNLSAEVLSSLLPHLHLHRSEVAYFENLVKLGTFESREARLQAIDRMSKYASYRRKNPAEAEFFEYASHWYHLAIREMAALPGFVPDPAWIRARLKMKVPLRVIRKALGFLVKRGYLRLDPGGVVMVPKDTLKVVGQVHRAALIQGHKQMFALATESIENTPDTERNLLGYTFSLGGDGYEAAKRIIDQALADLIALEEKGKDKRETVYQVELALFPLTKKGIA